MAKAKPEWVGITEHVSKTTIVDATDVHDKAMQAVAEGYLTVVGHCRFELTQKGRELLEKNGED